MPGRSARSRGAIALEDVSFGYLRRTARSCAT